MAKKKYIPRNQFRYSRNRKAGYHPHYIFGETKNDYISLGMTTHPKKYMKVFKIKPPNPNYNGDQYIQSKVFKMRKSAYDKYRKKGWKFSEEDKPFIRHLKKKYKKR